MLLQITEPDEKSASPPQRVVGIDLGTTHSVVAEVRDGKPQVLALGPEGSLIPSILTVDDGHLRVGVDVSETLRSTKRLMGEGGTRLTIGPYKVTPVEVAGHILGHLKTLIEKTGTLDAAVITVPAYFDEAARIATKQAAALAGIKVLRLLNEPTAAALAYGLETGAEGLYAVYDLGGGTFDVSILNLHEGVFQVLATGGDLCLGGDDVDQALARAQKISLQEARQIKESLSKNSEWKGFKREDLERLATPFVEKTLQITQDVLGAADLKLGDIKGVVLVGGMTRMPFIQKSVEKFFQKPPLTDMNPDEVVALGAALSAYGLTHGSDTLLLDVTPLSLGLETMGGLVEKIIPRNSPLPALASQDFTTHADGQQGMIIHVVQGEREFVKDCLSLARFELADLPSLPAGRVRVRVDFSLDVEGLLTVSAFEKTTGKSHHVEVRPSQGLNEKALKDILLESQKYGREDMRKRINIENDLRKPR